MHLIVRRHLLGALASILLVFNVMQQRTRADTEPPRVILGPAVKDLKVGTAMNAAGKDLRGSEFIGQDLTGAIFDGCCLYNVRFHDCILNRASFRGAIFVGSQVSIGPNFDGADFTNATINEARYFSDPLSDLKLSPHQLMSTWSYKSKDLHLCTIYVSDSSGKAASLDFRGADLREARIYGDCSECDFTDARIFGTYFATSSITFNQLASTSDFKRRRLRVRLVISRKTAARSSGKWDFSRIQLEGSDLYYPPSDADFTDARIDGCTICNGLAKQQLYSTASYKQGDLSRLRLVSSNLSGCDLSAMNLTGCRFFQCKFAGANFDNAVISGARFSPYNSTVGSDRLTIDQIKSTWNYKHNRMEGIRLPEEIANALQEKKQTEE